MATKKPPMAKVVSSPVWLFFILTPSTLFSPKISSVSELNKISILGVFSNM